MRARAVQGRDGLVLPALGQGTWEMGNSRPAFDAEVRALRLGIDCGLTLIDTAEMYASGGAEDVVGEALDGRRDEVFLVSKVLPENASYDGTLRAAERSLARCRTDLFDLYLLHWTGRHPVADTVRAFERLRSEGRIRHWGVSNFDCDDMEALAGVPGGERCAVNQILYNPSRRGVERNLLPLCEERGIVFMAYSPLEQGRLAWDGALARVAARHDATPQRVALAWSIRSGRVQSIVKSSREAHVRDNAAALGLVLTAADLAEIDAEYPVPDHDVPLECL